MAAKLKQRIEGLLLRLQPILRTDMLYAARGGFWLSAGSMATSFAAFLLAILLVNVMPKEAYGTYKYILSLVGVFSAFTLSGMVEAVSRSVARGHEAAARLALPRVLPWNAMAGALAVAAAAYYQSAGDSALAAGFLLVAAVVPLNATFSLYAGFLKGKKAFARLTKYGAARAFLPTVAVAAALPFTRQALPLAAVYLGATAAGTLGAWWLTRKRYPMHGEGDPAMMPFGLHLSFMNVLGVLATSIDKVVIFHYLGAADVALYSIAQAMPEQIDSVVSNVRHLAMPKFAAQDPRATIKALPRKVFLYMAMLLAVVGAYALVAKPFFSLLFPTYLEAVPFSIGLAFAFAATAPGQLPLAYLTAHGAVKERYFLGPIFSGVWIVLMVLFCRSYGLWGLVAAKLVVKFGGLFVSLWLAERHAAAQASPRG